MGMYTEFHLDARLRLPNDACQVLGLMLDGDALLGAPRPELPDHPLFTDSQGRYRYMLAATYWSTPAKSYIQKSPFCDSCYDLHVRCSFKNYNDEITNFLDWLSPYILNKHGDFLGYSLYESLNTPTLYFVDKYHVNYEHVTVNRVIGVDTTDAVVYAGLCPW